MQIQDWHGWMHEYFSRLKTHLKRYGKSTICRWFSSTIWWRVHHHFSFHPDMKCHPRNLVCNLYSFWGSYRGVLNIRVIIPHHIPMISPIYQIIPLCYSDSWLIHEAIRLIPLRSGLSFKASTIVATSHLRMLSISSVASVSGMVLYGFLCGSFMTSGLPKLETWLGQTLRPRACNSFWILNQPILGCQPDANAMLSLDSFQQMSFLDILGLTFDLLIYIYLLSFSA